LIVQIYSRRLKVSTTTVTAWLMPSSWNRLLIHSISVSRVLRPSRSFHGSVLRVSL